MQCQRRVVSHRIQREGSVGAFLHELRDLVLALMMRGDESLIKSRDGTDYDSRSEVTYLLASAQALAPACGSLLHLLRATARRRRNPMVARNRSETG